MIVVFNKKYIQINKPDKTVEEIQYQSLRDLFFVLFSRGEKRKKE